jgi:hypothetical protein
MSEFCDCSLSLLVYEYHTHESYLRRAEVYVEKGTGGAIEAERGSKQLQ